MPEGSVCSSCCGFARQSLLLTAGYSAARLKPGEQRSLLACSAPSSSPHASVRPFPCLTAAPSGLSVGYCPEIPKSGASSKSCLPALTPRSGQCACPRGFPPPLFSLIVLEQIRVNCREGKGRPVVSFFF